MEFSKVFLTNISLLITFGYILNIAYKYLFLHASPKRKLGVSVFIFIAAGWLSMLFGLRLTENVLFELEFVPVIFASLLFRQPLIVVVIGVGIGLTRLSFGWNAASFAGVANLTVLGVIAAALAYYFQKTAWSYRRKALLAILIINTANMINIALFGVVPLGHYFKEIAMITYPMGIALSGLFIFIIRDFYNEQKRVEELRNMNIILRRQTRELREAKRELEEKARQLTLASKYKSEFLANMSHELKTPLNSIILLSQMIRESREERGTGQSDEDDEARFAGIIHAAGNDLLQLINDILDLSKVEAGKMDIVPERVSTYDMLHMLYDQFRPVAQQKGLDFQLLLGDEAPESLYTDPFRINQILRNLLVNAFKFTEKGGVTLTLNLEREIIRSKEELAKRRIERPWRLAEWRSGGSEARRKGNALPAAQTKKWAIYAVKDTGIGIDPDKQELIFEAFNQADGSTNRKYGGTGLGLSISLQLARLLGGTLSLQSRTGEGSTFTLRIPVIREPEDER